MEEYIQLTLITTNLEYLQFNNQIIMSIQNLKLYLLKAILLNLIKFAYLKEQIL